MLRCRSWLNATRERVLESASMHGLRGRSSNRWVEFFLFVMMSVGIVSAQKAPERLRSLNVRVTGTDDSVIQSLTKDDFGVHENGRPVEIRRFETVETPFSILLLIDRSSEMEDEWLFLEPAIHRFLKTLRPQDRFAIAAFTDRSEILADWRSVGKGDPIQVDLRPNRFQQSLMIAGARISPDGQGQGASYSFKPVQTDFYGALSWSENQLQGVQTRKAVIVFSSGIQPRPPMKRAEKGEFQIVNSEDDREFQKILAATAKNEVPLYFLTVNTDLNPRRAFPIGELINHQQIRSRLRQLGEMSGGGNAYPRNPDEVAPLYEQIARELGQSYTLTFAATQEDSQIEVRVRGDNLRVRKLLSTLAPVKATVE
jgi:VWFA-related protein